MNSIIIFKKSIEILRKRNKKLTSILNQFLSVKTNYLMKYLNKSNLHQIHPLPKKLIIVIKLKLEIYLFLLTKRHANNYIHIQRARQDVHEADNHNKPAIIKNIYKCAAENRLIYFI